MREREHGGDWTGELLDFSTNVSPLGVPEAVRFAVSETAARLDRYPDPLCRRLRAAVGQAATVPPEQVLCGNGAADLIFRAALAVKPCRAVVTAPAFSEYEAALNLAGCKDIDRYPLRAENGFRIEETFPDFLSPGTDLLFLCQPNNPTGVTVPYTLLLKTLKRCTEIGCTLVLDECFVGFLDKPEQYTLLKELSAFPNLLILRAFTKLYGLAGVRLGYALCASPELLDRMRESGPPWSVSATAQAAGIAALSETDYVHRVRDLIARERPRLFHELQSMGFHVVPGEANFLLFQSPKPLEEPLLQRGILLRNCGNFYGLDFTWYRTAVRTEDENRRLCAALKEVLS